MSIRYLFAGAALAIAIGVTALFTSLAASSAYAGAGTYSVDRPIPSYLLNWDNPLVPQGPGMPLLGH
jgi:hypothetical protein